MRTTLTTLPLAWATSYLLSGCASTNAQSAVRVAVASAEPGAAPSRDTMPLHLQLRVHNAQRWSLSLTGVQLQLRLQGRLVGSGVAALDTQVAAFGEALVAVDIHVHDVSTVRQALGLYGAADRPLAVVVSGSLASIGFADLAFSTQADIRFQRPA
ncbi:LEA type 2 family protein [Roseateles sp. BYS180W]|uniref:LEA type 2 family protein n=1 Tax=Roseateles rivi TaxID=3299028 RepID=A0ABW7FYF2_9BURK